MADNTLPPKVEFTLDGEAVKFLREWANTADDGRVPSLRFRVGAGRSGFGVYVCEAEAPEARACLVQPLTPPDTRQPEASIGAGSWSDSKETPATAPVAPTEAEPTTDYVQRVPDHCDRITWRNRYYRLPLDGAAPVAPVAPVTYGLIDMVALDTLGFDKDDDMQSVNRSDLRRFARAILTATKDQA